MQGISKAKHEQLAHALLQLEMLLAAGRQEDVGVQQCAAYRSQLENIHQNYERLLAELAHHIAEYEMLYSRVKVGFLSAKLKSLKRGIAAEEPAFATLVNNIRLAYGT